MPIYAFGCDCGNEFEELVEIGQERTLCICGKIAYKKTSFTTFKAIYNCKGFYCTDNGG